MPPTAPADFRRRAIPGLALALLVLLPISAPARTMAPPSFPGSILTTGTSVVFAQPDGSLTELDAASGTVLHRTERLGVRQLVAEAGGLLVCDGASSVMVIDTATSTVVWEAPGFTRLLSEGMVVSITESITSWRDGVLSETGATECRDVATGRLVWSVPRPAEQVVAHDGRLAMRMMVDDPNVMLLDLATGRVLFADTHGGVADSQRNLHDAFFSGPGSFHRVFLAPDRLISVRFENNRGVPASRRSPRDAVAWDFDGREIARDPPGVVVPTGSETYRYGDIVLGWDGHTHPVASPPAVNAAWLCTFYDDPTTVMLACGTMEVSPTLCMGDDGGVGRTLYVMTLTGEDSWSVLAPDPYGLSGPVACCDNRLVLGRPNGEVEALDTRDGRSVWVYKPPRVPFDPMEWLRYRPSAETAEQIRDVLPGMGEAREHAREKLRHIKDARRDWEHGRFDPGYFVRIRPSDEDVCDAASSAFGSRDNTPRIVPDPKPMLVFRELVMLHAMLWALLLIPPGVMLLVLVLARLRGRDSRWIILPVATLLTPTLWVSRTVAPWSLPLLIVRATTPWYLPLLVAAIAVALLGAGLTLLAIALCTRRRQYAWALAGIVVAVAPWLAPGWLHSLWP